LRTERLRLSLLLPRPARRPPPPQRKAPLVAQDGRTRLFAPVTSRGEAVGVLRFRRPTAHPLQRRARRARLGLRRHRLAASPTSTNGTALGACVDAGPQTNSSKSL